MSRFDDIASALAGADWSNVPIGNKAIILAAIDALGHLKRRGQVMTHTYLPPTRSGDPYTVGYFAPGGWVALRDFADQADAEWHVHFLNGGSAVRDVGFEPRALSAGERSDG